MQQIKHHGHTLEELFYLCGPYVFDELLYFMEINRENSESKAALLKIIMTCFSGPEICMQPFIDMDVSIRPQSHCLDVVRDKPRISIVTSDAIIA